MSDAANVNDARISPEYREWYRQYVEAARVQVRTFLDAGLDAGLIQSMITSLVKQELKRNPTDLHGEETLLSLTNQVFDEAIALEQGEQSPDFQDGEEKPSRRRPVC